MQLNWPYQDNLPVADYPRLLWIAGIREPVNYPISVYLYVDPQNQLHVIDEDNAGNYGFRKGREGLLDANENLVVAKEIKVPANIQPKEAGVPDFKAALADPKIKQMLIQAFNSEGMKVFDQLGGDPLWYYLFLQYFYSLPFEQRNKIIPHSGYQDDPTTLQEVKYLCSLPVLANEQQYRLAQIAELNGVKLPEVMSGQPYNICLTLLDHLHSHVDKNYPHYIGKRG